MLLTNLKKFFQIIVEKKHIMASEQWDTKQWDTKWNDYPRAQIFGVGLILVKNNWATWFLEYIHSKSESGYSQIQHIRLQ